MAKYCKNHPQKESISFCHNCGEYYCRECLNEGKEFYYCNNTECYNKYLDEVGTATKDKQKKSSKLATIVLTIIIAAVAGTIGKQVATSLFKSEESTYTIDSQLQKISNEINKKCPMMVDSETRLDNTGVVGKSILYNYTFINYFTDELDVQFIETNLRETIRNQIKSNPDMKYLRDNRVTFVYNYKDKIGNHITSLKFTPEDYL